MIAEPLSILITDDDACFRETLRDVIAPHGFRTLLAGDGMEALDIVRHESVHLLLLDNHMPRLTGLQTIEAVKRFNSELPCILLSAEADERMIEEAMRVHAFAVLPKPVSRQSVIDNVRLALQRAYNWRERNAR